MSNSKRDSRRSIGNFFVMCMGIVAVALILSGCDGGGSSSSDQTNSPAASSSHVNKAGDISSNHGHTVILTAAQQDAGVAVTLELTPGNGHTHTVDFTAAQVQTIAGGGHASAESTVVGGHSHTVSF
jgi:hypothetical protein